MAAPSLPQIIQQFYSSQDPAYQKSAQEYLQNLQKEAFAWDLATQLLASQLTAYALQAVPTYWPDFIHAFYNDLRSSQIPQAAMESTLIEFLTVLPEEIRRADLVPQRRLKIESEVTKAMPLIMSTLQELISNGSPSSKPKALTCLSSWVQYGIPFESLQPLLGLVLNTLLDENTFDAAADVWSEIMSSKSAARYQNTIGDGLMPCFTSRWAQEKLTESIKAESEDISKNLCQLLSTFGDNFSDWIAARFLRADIQIYLDMMTSLAGFPGYYAEDETISDMTLNFWYMMQESLSELPSYEGDDTKDAGIGGGIEEEVVLDSISTASQTVGLDQESIRAIKGVSIIIYTKLIKALREKLVFPPQQEWIKWTRDIRQQFSVHRQDIADTIINSYHVLHQDMLKTLVDECLDQLNEIQSATVTGGRPLEDGYRQLEATLYCIKCLSEVVPHTENTHMPRFFSNDILGRLPSNVLCKARETALGVIGSYAEWFKVHPQFLLGALNYVIPTLGVPALAPYAARAFKQVCDVCRDSLVEAIDAFMTMFANVSNAIEPSVRESVAYSLATVIQALPLERSVGPLVGLLGDVFARCDTCIKGRRDNVLHGVDINAVQAELDPVSAMMASQLDYLLKCSEGLESPLEDEHRTEEERIQSYRKVVMDHAALLSTDMGHQLLRSMEETIMNVQLLWPRQPEMAEKTCSLLRSMMSTLHTTPLCLAFPKMMEIIEAGFRQNPLACWLDTAARLVSVYYLETTGGSIKTKLGHSGGMGPSAMAPMDQRSPEEHANEAAFTRLLAALIFSTMEKLKSVQDMEDNPDIVHSFFGLITQYIRHAPLSYYSLAEDQLAAVMNFMTAGLAMQERLALKATLQFMVEFVNQHYDQADLKMRFDGLIAKFGPFMVRGLLAGVGGKVPRSMVPQPGFPSPHADPLTKERFLKGIMQTRSPKRFREEVILFSNKCRQLDGSSFASAV
ncbi:hypothetical protein DFQ27_005627 [Actinomortierella ambigua]|uniref:Importin-13 n=1 Tax=Actinomortierella ambigua TaxID=1343610 RepID=A0A9P6U2P0_9FUNG|nr:hypothetical protein DFQ27_005627 [Actinomortierella ambigua]